VKSCERLMQEHQIRRIPIVNAEDSVIGIVSQADLALKDKSEGVSKTVAEISKPAEPSAAACTTTPRLCRRVDDSGRVVAKPEEWRDSFRRTTIRITSSCPITSFSAIFVRAFCAPASGSYRSSGTLAAISSRADASRKSSARLRYFPDCLDCAGHSMVAQL